MMFVTVFLFCFRSCVFRCVVGLVIVNVLAVVSLLAGLIPAMGYVIVVKTFVSVALVLL